jgi:hypothetical protein
LAKVIQVVDPDYMGKIRVQVLHTGSSGTTKEGQLAWATYMSPFFGSTDAKYLGQNNTGDLAYDDTQKSYGMWVPTPDIGSLVIVVFAEGMPNLGYWIGCVPDKYKNFMVPGLAATSLNTKDVNSRVPAAEFNAKLTKSPGDLATNAIKPYHPYIFKSLVNQGLINDDIRGITSTSARRESPSRVWGISTPGPVDKNGPVGPIGSADTKIKQAAHSRLGGTSFVIDDGDDKFIRNTPAGDVLDDKGNVVKAGGPPLYNALRPETAPEGDITIPHNELVRIRTRTGHQILLHNSEDLIYIGNAKGTAWIELTSNGKIDIYAADSISIHSKADLNITADRDVNIEAGRNINMKAHSNLRQEAGVDFKLVVTKDGYISTAGALHVKTGTDNFFTAGGNTNIKSGGNHAETAGKIYMNSSTAATAATAATVLSTHVLPDIENPGGTRTTILTRVPTKEPWEHHENLDPQQFIFAKTDRDSTSSFTKPAFFDNYTAPTDTFKQGKK